jgi:hypothetical protein
MKLEFLADGSDDCPLIRLYDFDLTGAMRLREALRALSDGSRQSIPLHEEWWMKPVDDCQLVLRVGRRDLGVVQRLTMRFECVLTEDGWLEVKGLTDPFCIEPENEAIVSYQWLNEDGEISLLLSPTGKW